MRVGPTAQRKAPPPLSLQRKPLNRAKAIREFCVECMNYQVQLVNKCPDLACPLWEWRRGPGSPETSEIPLRRQAYEAQVKSKSLAPRGHGATP